MHSISLQEAWLLAFLVCHTQAEAQHAMQGSPHTSSPLCKVLQSLYALQALLRTPRTSCGPMQS